MTEYAEKVVSIAREFGIEGTFGIYEITNGKINHTMRLDFISSSGEKESYVIQEVNTYVYHKPMEVMENIQNITSHIQRKGTIQTLDFLKTREGKTFLFDGDSFWRIFRYIDSVTFNSSNDLEIVQNAGVAYGAFQKSLSDFDASSLHDTIPDFHHTPKRYQTFRDAIQKDEKHLLSTCLPEVEYALEMENKAYVLERLFVEGSIPLRVTHNDTKINNVLFDRDTKKALCVVDLDTVMPGLAGHDFGDAIRSCGNTMGSGSLEFDKVRLNLDVFRHFSEGFLSETGEILTKAEKETLADSALTMTLELMVRYLTDYLTGDRYFKAKYPSQNLDRARNLMALSRDMDKKMDKMRALILSV